MLHLFVVMACDDVHGWVSNLQFVKAICDTAATWIQKSLEKADAVIVKHIEVLFMHADPDERFVIMIVWQCIVCCRSVFSFFSVRLICFSQFFMVVILDRGFVTEESLRESIPEEAIAQANAFLGNSSPSMDGIAADMVKSKLLPAIGQIYASALSQSLDNTLSVEHAPEVLTEHAMRLFSATLDTLLNFVKVRRSFFFFNQVVF